MQNFSVFLLLLTLFGCAASGPAPSSHWKVISRSGGVEKVYYSKRIPSCWASSVSFIDEGTNREVCLYGTIEVVEEN